LNSKILLVSPDKVLEENVGGQIIETGYTFSVVKTGKEAQKAIYDEPFFSVLLDVTVQNYSFIEVVRYIKCVKPSLGIFLYFPTKEVFEDFDFTKKDLRTLGISDVFIGTTGLARATKTICDICHSDLWKSVTKSNKISEEEEVTEADKKFTRLVINELHMGGVTIFDIYIRLKRDKYIKIFQKGDFFDAERIEKYKKESVQFLYFKTHERATYINFMNKVLSKALSSKTMGSAKKLDLIKVTSEKIFESIVTEGINPRLVGETQNLCKSMHANIGADTGLTKLLKDFKDFDPEAYEHAFLVSFFAVLICQNLEWGSERTSQIVGLAAILHDIGKLKLGDELKLMRPSEMNPEQLKSYESHPLVGLEILQSFPQIKEPVKQVIYQHHELVDGSGFPNSLTGIRIYPLAKIVNVADRYAHIISDHKLDPLAALKKFVRDREEVRCRDPEIMKALIMSFIGKK
jgi:putative nucleotidyltransferase with HDIG domain